MRIKTNVTRRALRKAAREVLVPDVRGRIPTSDDIAGFEHMARIKRGVVIRNLRDKKDPGVAVVIKGRDVPVGQGKSRRFWNLRAYSYLVAHGNYQTPDRPTRTKKQRRGDVDGIGNFMSETQKSKGLSAINKGVANMIPEIDKEIRKIK